MGVDQDFHRFASVIVSGAVNGAIMYSMASGDAYSFLGLTLLGVVGYGATQISRRAYWRLFASDQAPQWATKGGLLEIENWTRMLVWGLMNGVMYSLIFPYLPTANVLLGVSLGVFTVSIRDIIIRIAKMAAPELPSFDSLSIPVLPSPFKSTGMTSKPSTEEDPDDPSGGILGGALGGGEKQGGKRSTGGGRAKSPLFDDD